MIWNNRRLFWLWLCLIVAAAVATSVVEQRRLSAKLESESAILHRLASQRADQHDAHLTSLSAVAVAGGEERFDLFLDVANTITRFYPRIQAIDLVPLFDGGEGVSTRGSLPGEVQDIIREAARASKGNLVVALLPESPGSYLLVKRSPNTDAPVYGLALEVDAASLIASDSGFWTQPVVTRSLRMPDGSVLAGSDTKAAPGFSKQLGSTSQPLILNTAITPGLVGQFPPGRIAAVVAVITILYLVILFVLRQFSQTRHAERQMQLSAQEARLAHASRVNALGEMASGMAHELTQPLTAILSQVQAGRHLLKRGDAAGVDDVLNDTITQARRASAILDRLRRWTLPSQNPDCVSSLNDAVRSVETLLGTEATRLGAALTLNLCANTLQVRADPVELEQVIFNLVRNAFDAVASETRREVSITTRQQADMAVLDVADTGPGVPDELRSRLFEPFVTGRIGGTGLGLALCQRLVERMGGEIALVPGKDRTVFRISLPLATGLAQGVVE